MALAKRMIMMMMMMMMMRHANPVDDEDDESFAEDWAKGNGEREWGGAWDKEDTPNCSACTVRLGLWHDDDQDKEENGTEQDGGLTVCLRTGATVK
ncbi:hypothetical protein ACLKA6_015962 [Drosophila palustris]